MKKRLIILSLVLFASLAFGETIFKPISERQVTVDNTTGGVTIAAPSSADYAMITLQDAEIRYCVAGASPTTTFGTPIQVGQSFALETIEEIQNFRAIRTGSTSGKLNIIFYKSANRTTQ